MRVCHLINQLAPGGAPTLISDLIRATDDIEFTVCSIEGDESLVSDLREAGAHVVTFRGSFKFDPRALARMVSFFRGESFDVLHCHLPYAQTLGRLIAQISDVDRVVSTQHNVPSMYHPITRTLDRLTVGLDDATVAVSETTERAHTGGSHRFPEIGGQWTTIYNAVAVEDIHTAATSRSARGELALSDEQFLFVNVGRYVPSKEQAELIHAMKGITGIHPGAHLAIVGWGPEEQNLRDLVTELGIGENVTITGRVSEVEPYLGAADAFVLSSRAESFGIVLAEAMAAELPVIAPDTPVTREVVGPGCGQIVHMGPNNLGEALGRTMVETLEAPADRREEQGRAAYEHAKAQFGIKKCASSYLNLYESI